MYFFSGRFGSIAILHVDTRLELAGSGASRKKSTSFVRAHSRQEGADFVRAATASYSSLGLPRTGECAAAKICRHLLLSSAERENNTCPVLPDSKEEIGATTTTAPRNNRCQKSSSTAADGSEGTVGVGVHARKQARLPCTEFSRTGRFSKIDASNTNSRDAVPPPQTVAPLLLLGPDDEVPPFVGDERFTMVLEGREGSCRIR